MAEKTMHHAVIGADTFELVDQSARADVSDLKNAISQLNLASIGNREKVYGFFAGNGTWLYTDGTLPYLHIAIPVESGRKWRVKTNSGVVYLAFVKSYTTPVSGEPIDYSSSSGYSGRLETSNFAGIIPNDVKYVLVCVTYNGADINLKELIIDGYNYVDDIVTPVVNTIANKQSVYNITYEIPLAVGSYYTLQTAISAIPVDVRKEGLILIFRASSTTWKQHRFKVGDVSDSVFTNTTNWEEIYFKNHTNSEIINIAENVNCVLYENFDWQVGGYTRTVNSPATDFSVNTRQRTPIIYTQCALSVRVLPSYQYSLTIVNSSGTVLSDTDYKKYPTYIPENTYFRILIKNDNDNVDISAVTMKDYVLIRYTDRSGGAKWCAMGDSITQGYLSREVSGTEEPYYLEPRSCWATLTAFCNGWDMTNIAVGGTGYLHDSTNAGYLIAANTDYKDYDVVTLAYGVNDWKYNEVIGSMSDAYNTPTTIYGAMRKTIETIIASNPFCRIIVITPINCSAFGTESDNWGLGYSFPNSGTLEQIFEMEKTICEYYGIEMIDMTHKSIVNRKNIETCLLDGVHPDANTHIKMAEQLSGQIVCVK